MIHATVFQCHNGRMILAEQGSIAEKKLTASGADNWGTMPVINNLENDWGKIEKSEIEYCIGYELRKK